MEAFKPAFGLANRHIQTVYSSLFRKLPKLDFEIEEFTLSDGDFLECYWLKTNKQESNTPTVILFHGLAGSYESPYIKGAIQELVNAGFNTVLMHFRGCASRENRLPRSYHSGETTDTKEYIQAIKNRFPDSKLFCVGYSLGANMLLKLLGEERSNSLIDGAVAISAPMELETCANKMNSGFSKFYQKRLLKDLNAALEKKYKRHDMNSYLKLKQEQIKELKSFWDFDGAYTAPIHGFNSAEDYYTRCSSKQYLKDIKTPTLVISAKDDPFMTPAVLPQRSEISDSIILEVLEKGGHVGFVSGTLLKPKYWLDKRVTTYFKQLLG